MTTYRVTAERGSRGGWVFQCVEFPGAISEARRLADVHRLMPEAIAFVAEVPEGEVEIDLRPEVGDWIFDTLDKAREDQAHAEELSRSAAADTRKVAAALVRDGISMRDVGTILGVSHQRVAQLAAGAE